MDQRVRITWNSRSWMEFLSNKFQVYLLNGQLTVPSWITAEKSEAPLLFLSLSQSLSLSVSLPFSRYGTVIQELTTTPLLPLLRLWLYCFLCRSPAALSYSCCLWKAPPVAQVDVDVGSQDCSHEARTNTNGAKAVEWMPPSRPNPTHPTPPPPWWPRPN